MGKRVTIGGWPFVLVDVVPGACGVKHCLYRSVHGKYLVSYTDRESRVFGVTDRQREAIKSAGRRSVGERHSGTTRPMARWLPADTPDKWERWVGKDDK